MIALARRYGKGLTHLKEISAQEGISEKYLSQLILPLKASGLVYSGQGACGGYKLAKPPENIAVREIIEPLEGGMRVIDCVRDTSFCTRSKVCGARSIWTALENQMITTLDNIKLNSLIVGKTKQGMKR